MASVSSASDFSDSELNTGMMIEVTGCDKMFARSIIDEKYYEEKNLVDKITTEEQAYILGSGARQTFPDLREDLNKVFLRGFFDAKGYINLSLISCSFIPSIPSKILEITQEKAGVKGILSKDNSMLTFSGVNCLDFLNKIYEKSSPDFRCSKNYNEYCTLMTFYNTDIDRIWDNNSFRCRWKKNDPNALPLRKNRNSDSGYDLALIRKEKQLNQFTALYDTGIAVSPPPGYYFDVVPRSSFSKTGYIIANSVGIIDASYSGSIKVALIKVDDSIPELTLPNYLVQLVPRKYIHFYLQEVDELDQTERSDKGFGSTENKK